MLQNMFMLNLKLPKKNMIKLMNSFNLLKTHKRKERIWKPNMLLN